MSTTAKANQRLMTRNLISIREVQPGRTTAIIRHNKGSHTVTVDATAEVVADTICTELRAIHDAGENLTRRQKADRMFETLKA